MSQEEVPEPLHLLNAKFQSEAGNNCDSSSNRDEPKFTKQNDSNIPSLDELIGHLTSKVEKLTTTIQQANGRQQTSTSSSVARRRLLEKTEVHLDRQPEGSTTIRSAQCNKTLAETK